MFWLIVNDDDDVDDDDEGVYDDHDSKGDHDDAPSQLLFILGELLFISVLPYIYIYIYILDVEMGAKAPICTRSLRS